ncbi:MAG: hypothetical protein CMJ35_02390 [Phycisphaerae bacterium]|nr:hypothetical protein [Phycisphaerae bacterium]MBM90446.1 hypothetical protein [Phycisphaerae bacterium]HCT44299.1 hypothetical protein [Phycisphaerales bacterium]
MIVTVRDACVLQDNALDLRVSDQVEQLDELITAEGDGRAYFEKTHVTAGMDELIREGIKRLAGKSNNAIFHLKQAMGGGKTHLLVGFGLLAKHKSLRESHFGEVPHVDGFATVRIAAFNGRNQPSSFLWGDIAQQLGRPDLFKPFWEGGPKAPDERDWLSLFESPEPTLILLDELPPYFHYYGTQAVGAGTVADIATRAFANMLSAAGKKSNVCVVISDLAASYDTGSKLINRALGDAKQELGRQEHTITPVDLEGNEVYDILRKRLFKSLPSDDQIDETAQQFAKALAEAKKAKIASRSAEAVADEIAKTYPFHPQFKNIVALFKENETYKQTRGLMELVSRLLKSVWNRPANDVYLIGPQHFDMALPEVREKLADISGMRDVIAKDLWDSNFSAHAQIIDQDRGQGKTEAAQVGALLITASLSNAVNSVKGLTREEMVECLVAPLTDPSEYLDAFDELDARAWYLHHTPEGRHYFDRQENLTKLLQNLAEKAPQNKIDELIRDRLKSMYKASRKVAYSEVIPLPELDEIAERVRKQRVLVIHDPDSKMPPEEVARFFNDILQKNNLLVLTGTQSKMASLEQAARNLFAALQADGRIPKGHPQREELESKTASYEQAFNGTIRAIFDQLLIPFHRQGGQPQLRSKPLDQTHSHNEPFDGEKLIEQTLQSDPKKLYLDIEKDFDGLRDKAQDLLWPANQDEARWSDMTDRMAEQAGMPWLPPKGLEQLKEIGCSRGLWEDLGNGYVSKKPKQKKATVQVLVESGPDDEGNVRLRVTPMHAGSNPRIHYAENAAATDASPRLDDDQLTTKALRVQFLAVDPSGQHESDTPTTWKNQLKLRCELIEESDPRRVRLLVVPSGEIRFTLDGSEPRNGTPYKELIEIGSNEVRILAFAEADGLETKESFQFAAKGETKVKIDPSKPAHIQSAKGGGKKLDSRATTFTGLHDAKERKVTFENVVMTIGEGNKGVQVVFGEITVKPEYLQAVLESALEEFPPETPVTMSFRKAHFSSGHDLEAFAKAVGIELAQGEVVQE